MALTTAYSMNLKNLSEIMGSIQEAGVPERFTYEFLKTLGFSSSSDRTIIGILKGLDFLESSGKPCDNYKAYKDKTMSKKILAKSMKIAYEDIFLAHENAQSLSIEKIKGIIAAKTGKSDSVVEKMAATFKALCGLSDFSESTPIKIITEEPIKQSISKHEYNNDKHNESAATFHYNIQIHLPVTKDISVYNAIFKSLKDHLL